MFRFTLHVAAVLLCTSSYAFAEEKPSDTKESFESFAKELVAKAKGESALFGEAINALAIPNYEKWIAKTFDENVTELLTEEYKHRLEHFSQLGTAIQKNIQDGRTEVTVARHKQAIDMTANGHQNLVMQSMKEPVSLYTLRLIAKGEKSGTSYYSFAFVEGKFHFLGKAIGVRGGKKLSPKTGDFLADVLCALPLGDAEKLLKDKGMLEDVSAVEYLQQKGLLKKEEVTAP